MRAARPPYAKLLHLLGIKSRWLPVDRIGTTPRLTLDCAQGVADKKGDLVFEYLQHIRSFR